MSQSYKITPNTNININAQTSNIVKNFLEENQENGPLAEKGQYRKSNTAGKGNQKDSHEILDRRRTSDI